MPSGGRPVTPSTGYPGYACWKVGVDKLREYLAEIPSIPQESIAAIITAFAMAITSCGTPAFLMPNSDPRVVQFWKMFSGWDGKS